MSLADEELGGAVRYLVSKKKAALPAVHRALEREAFQEKREPGTPADEELRAQAEVSPGA
ncbi:hypothetical protein [Archangium sp.]|jgi:hypothetical protein|uniref:hypothetical protein n=1 Tax=Archangium sp. TaxID=1872627 RepID=UPI002EDADA34